MPPPTTEQLIEVADIRENVVVLKNNSLRLIVEVSSINFELRSEDEQLAIVQNFQQFLNSIDFPLQIVIQSRKFDIKEYIKYAQAATEGITNELLSVQAAEYMKYIRELSELANIMSKKFYIVVPFYVSEAPTREGGGIVGGLFKKAPKGGPVITDEQFATYRNQLQQRAELIFDGLVGMGLKTRFLEAEELKGLFFSLYNPGQKTVT